MIKYFVSYFFKSKKGGGWGMGHTTIERSTSIMSGEDIDAIIADILKKNPHMDGLTIINWQRFEVIPF